MKPLTAANTQTFLERIEFARDGEIRSLTMHSPTQFTLEMSVQDKNRGYDWTNVAFEINGVEDARLLDDSKIALADMSDGISVIHHNGNAIFAIGSYSSEANALNAVMYLKGASIKYEERPFSE